MIIFTLANNLLTLNKPEFIVDTISHSRLVSFVNAFMIDFICVRKYFIHREYDTSSAVNWDAEPVIVNV